ncbi:MAG: ribose-5-phosphate isomerase rki1 [Bogoriella megaspora]|nr:MAG: ribose-5-phosphate isomerase rki1 [Bogoriella megaspora]
MSTSVLCIILSARSEGSEANTKPRACRLILRIFSTPGNHLQAANPEYSIPAFRLNLFQISKRQALLRAQIHSARFRSIPCRSAAETHRPQQVSTLSCGYSPTIPSRRLASQFQRQASKMTDQIEAAKRRAAERAVAEHFSPTFRYVGIGSGSTIKYVVDAIKASLESFPGAPTSPNPLAHRGSIDGGATIQFVPTGYQSRKVVIEAGLTPIAFDSLPAETRLDVAFDGADEVDDELNCIKGGGACLFQEKLVATKAKKFVCVADYRKNQSRLLTKWPSIPIEVVPIAAYFVLSELKALGSIDPQIRAPSGPLAKSGPDKTDQGNFIIDAPFPGPLLTASDLGITGGESGRLEARNKEGKWALLALAKAIKDIVGVLDVGLFVGENGVERDEREARGEQAMHGVVPGQKPLVCYFGAQDGSVDIKEAKSAKSN